MTMPTSLSVPRDSAFSSAGGTVLSAIAAGFGWLPAAQPGAWALFFLIFLAVLLTMTLGFELYYRISGKKYDGLLGQYRASRTRDENSRGEY